MGQSNKKFLEQREIEARDNLSNYERFQLEKYGNILRQDQRPFPFSEMNDEDQGGLSTAEENYIYSLENPEA